MIERIPLEGRIKGGESLNFLCVEVPFEADRYIPFALVQYSIAGTPQTGKLRLDLDKRTFADDFGGESQEVLRSAGRQIAEIVSQKMRHWIFEAIRQGRIKE